MQLFMIMKKNLGIKNPFQLFQSDQGQRRIKQYQNLKNDDEKQQKPSKGQIKRLKKKMSKQTAHHICGNDNNFQQLTQRPMMDKKASQIYKQIINNKITCQICLIDVRKINAFRIGAFCKHYYCEHCLREHAMNSLKEKKIIICPEEKCNETLDLKGALFCSMNRNFRHSYIELKRNIQIMENPSLRFCPQKKCKRGVINLEQAKHSNPYCNNCKNQFCKQCWMVYHTGQCDKNVISTYKKNLKYKQCPKCFMLVEKTQGCDHIQCRCNFNFCYLCQNQWGMHKSGCVFLTQNVNLQIPEMQQIARPDRGFYNMTEKAKTIVAILIFIIIFAIIRISLKYLSIWDMFIALTLTNLLAFYASLIKQAYRKLIWPFLGFTIICFLERFIAGSWLFFSETTYMSYEILINE